MEQYRSEDATFTVELMDVNDNNPVYVPSAFYHFMIERGFHPGDDVGQVR